MLAHPPGETDECAVFSLHQADSFEFSSNHIATTSSTQIRIHAYGRERSSLASCVMDQEQAPVSANLLIPCQMYYTRSEERAYARQLHMQGNVGRKALWRRYKGSAAMKGSPERRI
jgi:hypothetical protein